MEGDMEQGASAPVVIKKYGNRRLYDTAESRYITLAELEASVRRGVEVRVVDSKTSEDLTQATLVQIILDSRGAGTLLPVALLTQLIRMGDDALAEFFGRYLSYALELYVQAKHGVQSFAPYNPFSAVSFDPAGGLSRMWQRPGEWARPMSREESAPASSNDDVASLRKELEALKSSLGKRRSPKAKRGRPSR
jgi:polyhydroxyalkanoate synthesis repressor PhaR